MAEASSEDLDEDYYVSRNLLPAIEQAIIFLGKIQTLLCLGGPADFRSSDAYMDHSDIYSRIYEFVASAEPASFGAELKEHLDEVAYGIRWVLYAVTPNALKPQLPDEDEPHYRLDLDPSHVQADGIHRAICGYKKMRTLLFRNREALVLV